MFLQQISKSALLWLLTISLMFSPGCLFRTTVPIPTLEYGPMDASRHKNLLILLRGMGGRPEDFHKHGIIEQIRSQALPFDVVVPDAHFGYYKSRTLEDRLRNDIIKPARQKGYQQIWLAGFSMGGLGSLFYLRQYKDDVDGVILVSPFMGWDAILDEISSAGGIQRWIPKKDSDNWQYLIWTWVKKYASSPAEYPPIFLGYGTDDGMTGKGPAFLRDILPPNRVFTAPGKHDYDTFKAIWSIHVNRLAEHFNIDPPEAK